MSKGKTRQNQKKNNNSYLSFLQIYIPTLSSQLSWRHVFSKLCQRTHNSFLSIIQVSKKKKKKGFKPLVHKEPVLLKYLSLSIPFFHPLSALFNSQHEGQKSKYYFDKPFSNKLLFKLCTCITLKKLCFRKLNYNYPVLCLAPNGKIKNSA